MASARNGSSHEPRRPEIDGKEVAPPVVLRVPPSELMTTTRHVMPLVPELHSTELSDPARETPEVYVSSSAYTAPEAYVPPGQTVDEELQ